MAQNTVALEQMRCHILLTNTAREAMKEHVPDEHAFFNLQQYFITAIEKVSVEDEQTHLTLYFDNDKNTKLKSKFDERVVIMDCVFDVKNGLVAKSFRSRGKGTPVMTNRRAAMKIHFVPSRISGHTYQEKFLEAIDQLPIAQERFDYVNKRISSWEGYLKVLNKNADIDDITARFTSVTYDADFSHMTMRISNVENKQWKQLEGLSARLRGYVQEIGDVVKARRGENTVEIQLKPFYSNLARRNELNFQSEDVEFSNAATKSQLKRLLKGFERLKEGLAANANLENILFEDKPVIAERKKTNTIDFHNQLNPYQQQAVEGAMSAEDLYVIQGPPGTGKTTVISEICYQNAKAGLKTLVASQSNLAVDNALSRLLSNKDIRILRYGRTESIEEEGKKFIEENVATYWQKQTFEAIGHEISLHSKKEALLNEQITAAQMEIQRLEEKQKQLKKQIEQKEAAKAELHVLADKISTLKKELSTNKKSLEENEQTLEKLTNTYEMVASSVENFAAQLAAGETAEELKEKKLQLLQAQETYELHIQESKYIAQYKQFEARMQAVEQKILRAQETTQYEQLIDKIASLKKVYEIEEFMTQYGIRRNYAMDRLLTALERIQPQMEQYKPIKDVRERLQKALNYSETALGIHIDPVQLPMNHSYSMEEVQEFLTKLSMAFRDRKVTPANGTRSIQGIHYRMQYMDHLNEKYMDAIRETVLIFEKLKEEISIQFKEQNSEKAEVLTKLHQEKQTYENQLNVLKTSMNPSIDITQSVEELQDGLATNELEQVKVETQLENRVKIEQQHMQKSEELTVLTEQLALGKEAIEPLTQLIKEINVQGIQLEKRREELEQLTKMNPEQAIIEVNKNITQLNTQITELQVKIELLPVTQELQNEWHGLLEQANAHDLEEIRKLYVKHANVIGTTCVASANKAFMDNYPTFDVVIIDEVSKATPPELLLPMLKGAKIILVGDHHQLPPLVGDATFEETLEQVVKESTTFEQKRELEKLLEESLFERLYKNLPKQNKTMLALQYRMHKNIMSTITPFYENETEGLQCGLEDSDAVRDHYLETSKISRKHHLLWLDIPNKKPFFEERMKEGSSLFNTAELEQIKSQLIELNEATLRAKEQGLIPQDALKSVGVISFYAEQVKRINRLIEQEISVPHLHIRTGSVDKFQGMEMDVIIVSMVRNHDNERGEIGFAKDYRRLNVALSRARELLIMIGSTDMFTKRPKQAQTKAMYAHVLNTVKEQNGYFTT
ncbi:DNA helicase [Lysinibacillus sp. 2017]|uniref:AAA domain-containing protein n=1 Tax=unclassified Lysinibacillus TaxID=2636778 RepID=UPI000D5265F4|nr:MULTISPECIES: AAA domain-containing protein [unclassified Lysinibacillus]AWE07529.1 DNA helicase [Lysinibacillus sp. 2017]TGN36691.1 DNA helicase [Lysinibacillus sp. S2017]